jgi:hypothetical protein
MIQDYGSRQSCGYRRSISSRRSLVGADSILVPSVGTNRPERLNSSQRNRDFRLLVVATFVLAVLIGTPDRASAQCQLNSAGSKIKHVIFVQFDNVHFRRDNPNVPSDLEQMPNLLNFLAITTHRSSRILPMTS